MSAVRLNIGPRRVSNANIVAFFRRRAKHGTVSMTAFVLLRTVSYDRSAHAGRVTPYANETRRDDARGTRHWTQVPVPVASCLCLLCEQDKQKTSPVRH